jgi:hypothetical protein
LRTSSLAKLSTSNPPTAVLDHATLQPLKKKNEMRPIISLRMLATHQNALVVAPSPTSPVPPKPIRGSTITTIKRTSQSVTNLFSSSFGSVPREPPTDKHPSVSNVSRVYFQSIGSTLGLQIENDGAYPEDIIWAPFCELRDCDMRRSKHMSNALGCLHVAGRL